MKKNLAKKGRDGAEAPVRKGPSWQTLFLGAVVVGSCVVVGYLALFAQPPGPAEEPTVSEFRLEDIPFDGAQAYEYLKQLCEIGPRPSGSAGMRRQQRLIAAHFNKLGGKVELQEFEAAHPLDGSRVPMANLIVRWHPERRERVLLCAHYDTLPLPMLDKENPKGTFVGANDGASGVAVLMELGRHMPHFESPYGVDFVLFDGEEYIFSENHEYFLGSTHFAREYRRKPPRYRYVWGVLLDMIGDADLQVYQEGHSVGWRDTRPLVIDLWATAARLGVREFIPQVKHTIRDDHLPLRNIARIPTCNLIDFDYPPWHTQGDTPDKCSALSLAKVGWVVHEWLKSLK